MDVAALLLICGKLTGVTVAQMAYPARAADLIAKRKLTLAERLAQSADSGSDLWAIAS
jgi:hypothetical protein